MLAAAISAVDAAIRKGADRILSDTRPLDRLALILGLRFGSTEGRPLEWLLETCRHRIEAMQSCAGTRAYDDNRMIGLLQAELALAEAVDFGGWAEARRRRPALPRAAP